MKTLQLILKGYNEGHYSLNEMIALVNETMSYRGYKMQRGKRHLKAMHEGNLIEVSI